MVRPGRHPGPAHLAQTTSLPPPTPLPPLTDEQLTTEAARMFAEAAAVAVAGDEAGFHDHLWRHSELLCAYLRGFRLDDATDELTEHYIGDALYRFLHTLTLVPLPPPARMLEIGSNPYFFHVLLHKLFPAAEIQGVNFFEHDIFSTRQGSILQTTRNRRTGEVFEFSSQLFSLETITRYPFPESWFDLVFFCETLEHLVVNPLPTFRRLKRILRPGGHLLITLPNAVRLANFGLMLHGHNFFDLYQTQNGVHGRHNREFTLPELTHLLQRDGFEVRRAETRDRYDYEATQIEGTDYSGGQIVVPERRGELLAILERSGGAVEDRGDNLYLLARKPVSAGERALREPPPEAPRDGAIAASEVLGWESEQVVVAVDSCEDSPRSLAIRGWAYRRDGDSPRQSAHLILESPGACYAFRAATAFREDAADAYGLQWDDPGYELELDKSALAPGSYRLGLLIHSSRGRPVFQRLPFTITVGGG